MAMAGSNGSFRQLENSTMGFLRKFFACWIGCCLGMANCCITINEEFEDDDAVKEEEEEEAPEDAKK